MTDKPLTFHYLVMQDLSKKQSIEDPGLARREVAGIDHVVANNNIFILRPDQTLSPSAIDHVSTPIFIKNVEGVYLDCNTPFEHFLELPRNEIIGKTAFDIAPKEVAARYTEMDQSLYQQGGFQSYEHKVHTSCGANKIVWFRKSIFCDAAGNPAGLIGEVLDITERKQAEEALQESCKKLATSQRIMSVAMGLARMGAWTFDPASRRFAIDDQLYSIYATTCERENGPFMDADVYYREFVGWAPQMIL